MPPTPIKNTSGQGSGEPAVGAFPINPSDTAQLDQLVRAVYVGVGGNVTLETVNGSIVTLIGVVGGTYIPIVVIQVFATGTTATGLIGLY
jgi:hypothetical protein